MDVAAYEDELVRCREELTARLGLNEMPDAVWGYVSKLRLPYDAICEGSDAAWQELVDEAKVRLRSVHGESSVSASDLSECKASKPVSVEPSEYSRRRSEALSEVAAAFTTDTERVRRIRREFLGNSNTTVSTDVARKMYRELLTNNQFRLQILNMGGLLSWRPNHKAWFVLTGNAPTTEPISVTVMYSNRLDPELPHDRDIEEAQIDIKADAWVPVTEVTKAFRDVQRQVLGGQNRPIGERSIHVARFVAQQIKAHGREPWHIRWERWNRSVSEEWHYKSYRELRQAFLRFTYPRYKKYQAEADQPR